ncbi:MAG: T9SS type A sorting domain-containing protein [Muribaculaceae bacterium]|nr:T9SS type A sorting domain-containing protein [Muribaculaceae bacterium]
MKKILLVILLLVCTYSLKAAEYEYTPLVREGSEWGYDAYITGATAPEAVKFYHATIAGKTTIDGKIYMNAYRYADCNIDITTAPITAYMREADSKVYMIPVSKGFYDTQRYESGKEYLLYDFNLKVGDKAPIGAFGTDNGDEIIDIKTIEINGKARKEFITAQYSIIEGIGIVGASGCYDFIYPLQAIPTGGRNIQFSYERNLETQQIVYKSAFYDANDACTGGIDMIKYDKNLTITAIDGKLKIKVAGETCQSIEIVNMNGQVVKKTICNNEPTASISTSNIAKGSYIVVVNSSKGVSTKKISL